MSSYTSADLSSNKQQMWPWNHEITLHRLESEKGSQFVGSGDLFCNRHILDGISRCSILNSALILYSVLQYYYHEQFKLCHFPGVLLHCSFVAAPLLKVSELWVKGRAHGLRRHVCTYMYYILHIHPGIYNTCIDVHDRAMYNVYWNIHIHITPHQNCTTPITALLYRDTGLWILFNLQH